MAAFDAVVFGYPQSPERCGLTLGAVPWDLLGCGPPD